MSDQELYADPTNDERAERAMNVMNYYDEYEEEDLESSINSLIADLLHLAQSHGYDALSVLEMGKMHFEAERDE